MATNQQTHALPNQEKWIHLTRVEVKRIFAYYILIFVASLIGMIFFIYFFSASESKEIGTVHTMLFALICGLLGSTFYYIRKLYKSCIQTLVNMDHSTRTIESLGAKVYFYVRPLMGATLSLLVVFGVYGGFFVLLDQPVINSDKFYIFVALVAFAIGFSNGKVIVKLDDSRDKIAEMIRPFKKEEYQ